MLKTRTDKICLAVCVVLVAAIIAVAVTGLSRRSASSPAPAKNTAPEEKVVYRNVETLVEVEKEISSEMIEDGLRDMGVLVTGEYYFTGVMSYSSAKELFGIKLPLTESGYLVSYDGTVTAGADFSSLTVEKDELGNGCTVRIPKCSVFAVDIDPESFTLYSEKHGLGNRVSIADYNDSLIELEHNASETAVSKGLLESSEAQARLLIKNFAGSLLGVDTRMIKVIFT